MPLILGILLLGGVAVGGYFLFAKGDEDAGETPEVAQEPVVEEPEVEEPVAEEPEVEEPVADEETIAVEVRATPASPGPSGSPAPCQNQNAPTPQPFRNGRNGWIKRGRWVWKIFAHVAAACQRASTSLSASCDSGSLSEPRKLSRSTEGAAPRRFLAQKRRWTPNMAAASTTPQANTTPTISKKL